MIVSTPLFRIIYQNPHLIEYNGIYFISGVGFGNPYLTSGGQIMLNYARLKLQCIEKIEDYEKRNKQSLHDLWFIRNIIIAKPSPQQKLEEHCANLLENLKKARTTNPHRYLLIDELTDIISVACGLKKRADLDTTQEIEQATDCDTDDDANSLDGAQIIWNNQTPEEPPKEDDLDECSQPYSP